MEPISGPRIPPRMPLTTTYSMPGYLLMTYAFLLLSLGWFAHQRWMEKPTTMTASATAPTVPIEHEHNDMPSQPAVTAVVTPSQEPITASSTAPEPPAKPATRREKVENGRVPPLVYSAHVFTSDPAKRSITLNGVRYQEGESPLDGLVIEQIQQDITLFDADGEIFILDALSDWPGGDIKEVGTE